VFREYDFTHLKMEHKKRNAADRPKSIAIIVELVLALFLAGCSTPITPIEVVSSQPQFIWISGHFKNTGQFRWKNGMTAQDAIDLGKLKDYPALYVRVYHPDGSVHRLKMESKQDHHLILNLPLQPGDKVYATPDGIFR
jgi:protein involved in polysaccharide export with SLBB domain